MLIVGQISTPQEAKEIDFIIKVFTVVKIASRLTRQKES
ncbi:hypothetical protein MBGDN05_00788 [Thermoplasmatales archaeon SCGC AB-539-N05]|nr:hypothetical protein MBGDN05_00788 [Thermoplasmatales archaeon SCGC AB-539-N05]